MSASAAADDTGRHFAAARTVDAGTPHRRRRWAKSDATQERILSAATGVFRAHGYSAATIGDVVAASGASIGSIYHHFGGKAELFCAIHEHMASAVEATIAEARQADTAPSLQAQARAYLRAVWSYRSTAIVLAADDVPPGFDAIRRTAMRARFRDWVSMLDVESSVNGQLLARAVIAVLNEAAAMVMYCDDTEAATPVIDAAIDYINRLTC